MTKRQRDLLKLARACGWSLERLRRHFRLRSPGGAMVVASVTPSARDLHILAGQMRRAERVDQR